jgi:C4-type Zn-finger protein
MSVESLCPLCGGKLKINTTENPLRNVIKVYVKCSKCGFERAYERPPEVTLRDWLKQILEEEKGRKK